MAKFPHQSNYDVKQARGRYGLIARSNGPYAVDFGPAYVPNNGTDLQPGYGVYWNSTNNGFAHPTTDAQLKQIVGVCSYNVGTVQSTLSSGIPSGSNTDKVLKYANGVPVRILVSGAIWLKAGTAAAYGDILRYNRADKDWDKVDVGDLFTDIPAAFANLPAARTAVHALVGEVEEALRYPIVRVISRSVSAGGLVLARLTSFGA